MSAVDCKVELGSNVFQYVDGNFVLDSDTLGVLGDDKLSGLTWTDITEYVQTAQIRRGRSRQLDYFQAGTATINLNNASRVFDPLNSASPLYPGIEPRCLIRVSSRSKFIFTGFVNDWDLGYDISNQDTAVAYCAEAFMILANQLLSEFTPSTQATGARINTVLNRSEVGYRGGRNIANGNSTLGNYLVTGNTNVLNYLRQVERSELGALFVDADGTIVFRERGQIPTAETLTFDDSGDGIPYQSLENQFGDELLYNYVRADSPAGAEQIASDATSIAQYQTSQLSWGDLLNSSTAEVLGVSQVLLGQYKNPKVRFTGFSVQLAGLSDDQKDQVLDAELTDFVNLSKSFVTGSPSTFTQLCVLTGITHEIRPDSHRITFAVENAESLIFLVLGDSFAGQLDLGVLDF
jgi:hypothetical protein